MKTLQCTKKDHPLVLRSSLTLIRIDQDFRLKSRVHAKMLCLIDDNGDVATIVCCYIDGVQQPDIMIKLRCLRY